MNSYRKKQLLTVAVLFIMIAGLSIGFSALSKVLNIETDISVNPNKELKVLFSSSNDGVKTDSIIPNKSVDTISANNGIIDNSTNPKVKNLGATFTTPGESVKYEFYVKNIGSMKAYLTNVKFNNAQGSESYKNCVPNSGTSNSSVDSACNGIKVSLKFENSLDEYTNTTEVSNHPIDINGVEKITVTLVYEEGSSVANESFKVYYGSIELIYSSISSGSQTIVDEDKACTVISGDGTNIGDEIKCGTEEFYVITNDGNNISMLAKYNLNVGGSYDGETITNYANPTGKQSSNMKGVYLPKDDGLCTVANPCEGVLEYSSSSANYDSDSVKKYVDAYRNILVAEGLNDATTSASLITLDTLTEVLSCSLDKGCPITSPWIYSTTYYTRSLNESGNKIYIVHTSNAIFEGGWKIESDPHFFTGVRPVITISTSEI